MATGTVSMDLEEYTKLITELTQLRMIYQKVKDNIKNKFWRNNFKDEELENIIVKEQATMWLNATNANILKQFSKDIYSWTFEDLGKIDGLTVYTENQVEDIIVSEIKICLTKRYENLKEQEQEALKAKGGEG